ncbi:MAG: acylphosphatase [Planctomycetes bacterium]|nr:acylphosphatase [Planctomycetota bacterium]
MKNVQAQVIVSGLVQGVFFRTETQRAARSRELVGWVRNRPDGTVEAVFVGPNPEVKSMIEWCHQGPSEARVSKVDVHWVEASDELTSFDVRY